MWTTPWENSSEVSRNSTHLCKSYSDYVAFEVDFRHVEIILKRSVLLTLCTHSEVLVHSFLRLTNYIHTYVVHECFDIISKFHLKAASLIWKTISLLIEKKFISGDLRRSNGRQLVNSTAPQINKDASAIFPIIRRIQLCWKWMTNRCFSSSKCMEQIEKCRERRALLGINRGRAACGLRH